MVSKYLNKEGFKKRLVADKMLIIITQFQIIGMGRMQLRRIYNLTCKIILFRIVQLEHTKSDDLVRIPFGAKDLVKIL